MIAEVVFYDDAERSERISLLIADGFSQSEAVHVVTVQEMLDAAEYDRYLAKLEADREYV